MRVVVLGLGWQAQAACRHSTLDFTPEHEGPEVEAARAVCATCPVKRPCLAYALDTRSCGVWGGEYLPPSWVHSQPKYLARFGHLASAS
jgi:WhiB family redox-sensing transcriptional regulator